MGINLSFDSTATEAELRAVRAYINARLGEERRFGASSAEAPSTTKLQPEQNPADEPEVTTEAINDASPAPARRKPGPKPKPKPEPEPVTPSIHQGDEAAVATEEPEDEADVMGDAGGFSVDDAKSKARELVGEGKTADVRKALQAVGKNRVSEITTGAEATAFMKALG